MAEAVTEAKTIDVRLYSGADWLKAMGKPVSPFGARVADLIGWVFRGVYHAEREVLRWDGNWPTYDNDMLTRLVVAAHDLCIRVEVHAAAYHWLQVWFSPRTRDGLLYDRHATIEEAVARMRSEG